MSLALTVVFLCIALSRGDVSTQKRQCLPNDFRCIKPEFAGKCIPSSQRCDGKKHCPDSSDEANCIQCSETAFRCKSNGKCIPSAKRCDCPDEANCIVRNNGAFVGGLVGGILGLTMLILVGTFVPIISVFCCLYKCNFASPASGYLYNCKCRPYCYCTGTRYGRDDYAAINNILCCDCCYSVCGCKQPPSEMLMATECLPYLVYRVGKGVYFQVIRVAAAQLNEQHNFVTISQTQQETVITSPPTYAAKKPE